VFARFAQPRRHNTSGSLRFVARGGRADRHRNAALADARPHLDRATARGVVHDVKEYSDAGHSLLNNHDKADVPVLFTVMFRLSGSGHDWPSARDARGRITSFFKAHLAS
jgi:carboxymethylenebutenolidase